MKGNNTFIFNEATIIVAIQEYLNKRITTDTPKVTSVKSSDKTLSLFQIDIQEDKDACKANL